MTGRHTPIGCALAQSDRGIARGRDTAAGHVARRTRHLRIPAHGAARNDTALPALYVGLCARLRKALRSVHPEATQVLDELVGPENLALHV